MFPHCYMPEKTNIKGCSRKNFFDFFLVVPTKFQEKALEVQYDLTPKLFGILQFLKDLDLKIIGEAQNRKLLQVQGLQKSLLFGQGYEKLNPSAVFKDYSTNSAYFLTDIFVVSLRWTYQVHNRCIDLLVVILT